MMTNRRGKVDNLTVAIVSLGSKAAVPMTARQGLLSRATQTRSAEKPTFRALIEQKFKLRHDQQAHLGLAELAIQPLCGTYERKAAVINTEGQHSAQMVMKGEHLDRQIGPRTQLPL